MEHEVRVQEFEDEFVTMLMEKIERWLNAEDHYDISDILIRQRDGNVYFARIYYYV